MQTNRKCLKSHFRSRKEKESGKCQKIVQKIHLICNLEMANDTAPDLEDPLEKISKWKRIHFLQVCITKFRKYKTWDSKVRLYIVIFLSCPPIGSLSSSIRRELKTIPILSRTLGIPVFVILKLFYLYLVSLLKVKKETNNWSFANILLIWPKTMFQKD